MAGLSILLTIIFNVCAHILLTSLTIEIFNIDIDNIIDRVRSAYVLGRKKVQQAFLSPTNSPVITIFFGLYRPPGHVGIELDVLLEACIKQYLTPAIIPAATSKC